MTYRTPTATITRLGLVPERLSEIIATMDVPEARTADFGWLMRNLAIRNSAHPNRDEAIRLARFMHRVMREVERTTPDV